MARGRGPSLANKFGAAEKLANGATVAVDEAYVRESILTPQAKLVDGLSAADADVPGAGQRGERDGARRVREVAAGQRARSRADSTRGTRDPAAPRRTGKTMDTTMTAPRGDVPQPRAHGRVVAPDQGPQAHRHDVPRGRDLGVLPRRPVRLDDSSRAGDAGRATSSRPTPTTRCSPCTAWPWCSSC